MATQRINYEIVGEDGLILCVLYSNSVHTSTYAERVFLDANKAAIGPSDLIETLLRLRYPPPAPDNSRMFWVDTSPGGCERVLRVHYGLAAHRHHVEVSTDGVRWVPITDIKHDERLHNVINEPSSSLDQAITASVARGSFLTTYVSLHGDITGITYLNSVEVDREMFSAISKGLFTQEDLYDYALKRQTFLRAAAARTHVTRRPQ